ncbi:MAG TPA: 1-acyl-sn-glycerol-3-phosphate acyltransferase [Gallionella sp.]|nr:lysophospholipid acyltransferase family protein [Gallionella sp.]OGS67219.1 MAG: acyl-phosphate glycerol 3-phosphate acyltransferase [Gallionellales bacterium GWA2_54_124]OGT20211.1 MAG: acyl-phosphate glycerol 3-phosphate acyltransferase [Gallionellales bacterium RIFOXYD12_FULL_53_10]HCI52013.1 1-acyl-sn-glycerol-3-phosphate acyltransferase [Gallionella sp.]
MLFIRSFVFILLQLLLTPVFSVLAIFTFPFSPLTRYRLISSYAKTMIWLVRVVCGIRHKVIGIEHIPPQPCIVLCKHQSAWETLALQAIFPPQAWVLKRELLWIPFFGWGLAMTSPIAINRSDGKGAVKQLLKQGKARLAQGFFVVIFPEGTRIPYGQRGKYKVGGALLAASAGVPVIPVAHNAGRLWGRAAFIKKPGLITMSIGQPIETTGLKADEINARTESWIENEISTLDH